MSVRMRIDGGAHSGELYQNIHIQPSGRILCPFAFKLACFNICLMFSL